jgi:hypothetical protein
VSAISALLVRLVVARLASFAHDAPAVLGGVCFCVLLNGLGRHAIAAVDPPGKILKLAALAAEGNPGCVCGLATAQDTHASRHSRTFYLTLAGSGFLFPFRFPVRFRGSGSCFNGLTSKVLVRAPFRRRDLNGELNVEPWK